jgi:hypothetical protein
MKKKLEDALSKMGDFVSPEVRKIVEDAIANLDHTDPQTVRMKLPEEVQGFFKFTVLRAYALISLIERARDAECHIEAIILAHGLIQFALRALFVLGWQRAVDRPLTTDELAPFYKQSSRNPRSPKGDVYNLAKELEQNGLIQDYQAAFLLKVNKYRNRAAHGVIFGEIEPDALAELSMDAQRAAKGILQRLLGWFDHPIPLQEVPS